MLVLIQLFLGLLTIVAVVVGLVNYDATIKKVRIKPNKKLPLSIIPLILCVVCSCIVFIPANTVGIRWSAFSGTSETTLDEGIAIKTPVDKIYQIPTTVQEKMMENVAVQTLDAQWVSMSLNIKYQVDNANAYKVFKNYKTLDNLDVNLISNVTQRSVEEVTTKYNVIDILGEQRNDIYIEIENILKEKLAQGGVTLKFITIIETDAGEEIEAAIAKEAVAKMAVETAEQDKKKAEIDAQTKLIKAEGEAKANEIKTKQLTDEILTEMFIEKWDGKLPTVSGSDGMMIDVSNILGQAE